jgi:hypothetical protein
MREGGASVAMTAKMTTTTKAGVADVDDGYDDYHQPDDAMDEDEEADEEWPYARGPNTRSHAPLLTTDVYALRSIDRRE